MAGVLGSRSTKRKPPWSSRPSIAIGRYSEDLLAAAAELTTTKAGWIYAAVLAQSARARHLKVGFTKDLRRRLSEFRTTSPTAAIVAAWDGDRGDETRAHAALPGRIGRSEVFIVSSLVKALASIDGAIGARRL